MSFENGQEVVVKKALGGLNGRTKREYYHGGDLRIVPLGAKGVVAKVSGEYVHVHLGVRLYGEGGEWNFHPDEVALDNEQEERGPVDSVLEETLLEEPATSTTAGKELAVKSRNPIRNLFRGFVGYLSSRFRKKEELDFSPQFNPREEFYVWMQENFTEEGRYRVDKMLENMDEVYEAALKACEHGIRTTRSCIRNEFTEKARRIKSFGESDSWKCDEIMQLLDLIQRVSVNLKGSERKHYGTQLGGTR